jgi:phosphoribosylaminoimidazole-succinocarboxamide synthase
MVLNQLSAFWFEHTSHIVPNHFIQVVADINWLNTVYKETFPTYIAHRSMVVKKAERIPIECVVRGYLSGSAWAEYSQSGTVSGMPLPQGLKESERLSEPLFTPTTKAATGHDLPITLEDMEHLLGKSLTQELEKKSIEIYRYAEGYARSRGIIVADTKMEFGIISGRLHLIDELLTPDSSRFWDAESYAAGGPQPSFDKQPLRDWLTASGWDKEPPAPLLPQEVVAETTRRYKEAYHRLSGRSL